MSQTLGQRGLLYSLVELDLFAAAAIPLRLAVGWPSSLALMLGYASHLAADACTRSGIPFLYPSPVSQTPAVPSTAVCTALRHGSIGRGSALCFVAVSGLFLLMNCLLLNPSGADSSQLYPA